MLREPLCLADALDMAALGPAARASLGSDLPVASHIRQHSWTAGRAAPKYRPPVGPSGSLLAARLGQLPRASPALTSLSPLHEDVVSAHNASTPQRTLQQSGQLQGTFNPHGQLQNSFVPNGQLQNSFPESGLQAQHQQPVSPSHGTQAVELQQGHHLAAAKQFADPDTAPAGPRLTSYPPLSNSHTSAQPDADSAAAAQQESARLGRADDTSGAQAASAGFAPPARPLSPFLEEADLPFNGSTRLKPVTIRPCIAGGSPPHDRPHTAGVHFAQNHMFTPLDAPVDGRWVLALLGSSSH